MKKCISLLYFMLATVVVAFAQSAGSSVVADGAKPVLVASDYEFTEGPAVDRQGNVYFTDQPNNRILKWTEGKGVTVFMENAGRSNGLYFDRKGNLLACADEKNELWSITPDKKVTVLIRDFEGKKLNGPNDLWIDPKGGIYFTDPFYKRPYWTRTTQEIETCNVYYLSPDGKKLTMVMDGFNRPNGIIGSPDGKTLYVSDIAGGKTYSFKIQPDGTLTDRKLFVEMGSDGMTLDSKGNLYLTGKGVTVFDKSGNKVDHIAIEEPWTANVCFAGKKGKTLFVTASKSVYTVQMKVKGAGL
jgi:gluconolactonase